MIQHGDKIHISIREHGQVVDAGWFALVLPTDEMPDGVLPLNPRSIVGALVLGLEGPGSKVTYSGPADCLDARRNFDLEVTDVVPGGAFLPRPGQNLDDVAVAGAARNERGEPGHIAGPPLAGRPLEVHPNRGPPDGAPKGATETEVSALRRAGSTRAKQAAPHRHHRSAHRVAAAKR